MHIPTDVDVNLRPSDDAPAPNAYVPERCIHTFVSRRILTESQCLTADRSQQGRLRGSTLPPEWSLAAQCQYGHKGQIVGRLPRGQLLANLHGPLPGCQGYRLQQQWREVPVSLLRSSYQVVGYRDGQVYHGL